MKCKHCGHYIEHADMEDKEIEVEELDEGSIKSDLIDELLGVLDKGMASKLKPKPDTVSIEMLEVKPKKKRPEDEEEEY